MSIEINFKNFIISELLYKVEEIPLEKAQRLSSQTPNDEHINEKTQLNLSFKKNMSSFFTDYNVDIKTYMETTLFRTISLKIQFNFDINTSNNLSETMIMKKISDAFNTKKDGRMAILCHNQVNYIIKQITSMDYQPPINRKIPLHLFIEQ